MTRLRMETAEDAGPDAASYGFGARPGTPGRVGAVACWNAAWRDDRRRKPHFIRTAGRGSPVEDNKVCPPGLVRSKPQTSRAGRRRDRRTCGFMLPDCPGVARCQGPWVFRTPGVPRPLGLSQV